MKPSDAAQVLTLASVYDNRNFDEPTARVWADALDGLELSDCLDAVRLHYRKSRQWLMPADVRELARSVIRDRQELERKQAERLAVEGGNAALAERRKAEITKVVETVGRMPKEPSPHPKQDDVDTRLAKRHVCPWCKATVGASCTNTATGKPVRVIHEQRLIAAGLVEPVAS